MLIFFEIDGRNNDHGVCHPLPNLYNNSLQHTQKIQIAVAHQEEGMLVFSKRQVFRQSSMLVWCVFAKDPKSLKRHIQNT